MNVERPASAPGSLLAGAAIALVLSAAWVALSLQTGLNHHLFPLVIAAAPLGLPGVLGTAPLATREAVAGTAIGLAAVWGTWLLFVLMDEGPTATFIHGQPGGALGEAVVLSVAGGLLAYLWNAGR